MTQQQELNFDAEARGYVAPSRQVPQTLGDLPQEGNYYQNPEGPRYNNPAEYDQAMAAQTPQPQQPGVQFNVPDFAAMRQVALQQAIEQVTGQQTAAPQAPPVRPPQPIPPNPPRPMAQEEPQIIYVRRNLTLAELILVFALSVGMVTGVQFVWQMAIDILPRIEIRDK